MSYKSLFSIEMEEGGVKVKPSEELKSMTVPKQLATVESKLKIYEAELEKINNQVEENANEETPGSDKCELELVIMILKKFRKQFREANWERINP